MREVTLQMLWYFLYSQTYHLQLSLQFQVFVDDDVCIVRAFHILHHVVWYVLPDDTPETLQRRVMEQAEWQLLPQAAELVSEQIVKEKRNA